MKITKYIDAAGKYFLIPIRDDERTVGLTISGIYSGVFQIVGMISQEGGQIDLNFYNIDGSLGDLNDPPPLDLFIDVLAGISEIRIYATSWVSGTAALTAVSSNAKRYNSSSSSGSNSDVNVVNLPPNAAEDSSLQTLIQYFRGIDSNGDLLPLNFDSYASTFAYDSNSLVQSETRVVGSDTYIRSYLYDSNENVIGSSAWVKS